ncbi:hypothetical protein XA68_15050 [Ophiocordyceps unilateralis]|uniref:Uncharacterized protein n=1 Tax=Ophiocordyceps unilateralis TaxID=268505 RepID=A0A2A9P8A7_OPHUN|nr:hypothetical protein XA68_15050 [Ophiocordyceps unilateralis]
MKSVFTLGTCLILVGVAVATPVQVSTGIERRQDKESGYVPSFLHEDAEQWREAQERREKERIGRLPDLKTRPKQRENSGRPAQNSQPPPYRLPYFNTGPKSQGYQPSFPNNQHPQTFQNPQFPQRGQYPDYPPNYFQNPQFSQQGSHPDHPPPFQNPQFPQPFPNPGRGSPPPRSWQSPQRYPETELRPPSQSPSQGKGAGSSISRPQKATPQKKPSISRTETATVTSQTANPAVSKYPQRPSTAGGRPSCMPSSSDVSNQPTRSQKTEGFQPVRGADMPATLASGPCNQTSVTPPMKNSISNSPQTSHKEKAKAGDKQPGAMSAQPVRTATPSTENTTLPMKNLAGNLSPASEKPKAVACPEPDSTSPKVEPQSGYIPKGSD